ncbi:MAG: PIN domain-containing protein [Gammaproteobacteria bacterium]|nr:MAG: PIN domain-containing protein [Gammaproteobacteria bacterium]
MSFAIDANILVYASDESSAVHARAATFVRQCAEGSETLCLAWATLAAYLRIATHPAVFRKPLTAEEAMANVDSLLRLPHARPLGEEEDFWRTYQTVAREGRPRGNQVPDTFLAALLRQHGVATLFTRDRDFRRYDFLTVIDPLESAVQERRRGRYRAQAAV